MNEKITLPSLVGLLSAKTGKPKKQCEDFLREFFYVLVASLSEGDNVRIKGLGTFKVVPVEPRKSVSVNTGEQIEIPGHNKVVFVPAKELAEEVNAPFAMFESVELPDEITDTEEETIAEEEETVTTDDVDLIVRTSEKDLEPEVIEPVAESEKEETPSKPLIVSGIAEVPSENNNDPVMDNSDVEMQEYESDKSAEDVEEVERPRKNYRFLLGFTCGVACSALICLGAYLFFTREWTDIFNTEKKITAVVTEPSKEQTEENRLKPEIIAENDSVVRDIASDKEVINGKDEVMEIAEEIAPTQPSDKKTYDTISKTRYLTTMAKEHYGNYNLWPYIYEENKAILGHPDRIRPGTKVVIPSLSRYGVDPKNPEDIRRAKSKGVEIYSKYR